MLRTDIPLAALPRTRALAGQPVLTVTTGPEPSPLTDDEWLHHWGDDDSASLSLARDGTGYRLEVPGACEFSLQFDTRTVIAHAPDDMDADTLEHLLVDQVLPRYLSHEGELLLHASAVVMDGAACLFVGKSGWGKSTLAGLLHRQGHPLLSDDCVMLRHHAGHVTVLPTYPSLRVYKDTLHHAVEGTPTTRAVASHSGKRRVDIMAADSTQPPRVGGIYLLSDPKESGSEVHISPMAPAESCMTLVGHAFQLDVTSATSNARLLALAGEVTRARPMFRLDYPREYHRSDELIDRVRQHAASLTR